LLGRAVLGAAESFIVTGAFSWGLALAGPQNTGKIMAWVGTAMYAAFAVGAPAGITLYASYGFMAIALATTLIPLLWHRRGVAAYEAAESWPHHQCLVRGRA
jgi:MFS family permease